MFLRRCLGPHAFANNSSKITMQHASIHGPTEGVTASTKGSFSDKERAVEDVWARQAEAEKIKMLRGIIEEQKKTTEGLKKELDKISKKLSE